MRERERGREAESMGGDLACRSGEVRGEYEQAAAAAAILRSMASAGFTATTDFPACRGAEVRGGHQTQRGHGPIIVLVMARVRQNGESS